MSSNRTLPADQEIVKMAGSLADRLDPAIGEASSVMGAMLTELVRRALRGGVVQIGEDLHGFAREKVLSTIDDHRPVLEQISSEVADQVARTAATEIAREEIQVVDQRHRETAEQLATRLQETSRQVEEKTQSLSTHLQETEHKVEQSTQELSNRIDKTARHAEEINRETARELVGQIEQASQRVSESTNATISEKVEDLLAQSRRGAEYLKSRLKQLDEITEELRNRLQEEQAARQSEQATARAEADQRVAHLMAQLQQERDSRKEELSRLQGQLRGFLQANEALAARLAELEKPRGFKAFFSKLMPGRKKEDKPALPEPPPEEG